MSSWVLELEGDATMAMQYQREDHGKNDLRVMAMKISYIRRHRSINISNSSSGDGECVDAVMHSSLLGRIIAGKPYRMVVYVHKQAVSSPYAHTDDFVLKLLPS